VKDTWEYGGLEIVNTLSPWPTARRSGWREGDAHGSIYTSVVHYYMFSCFFHFSKNAVSQYTIIAIMWSIMAQYVAAHLVDVIKVLLWTDDHLSPGFAVVPVHQSLNTCMLK